MNDSTRPRGVYVYPMPEEISGPGESYALVIRDNSEGLGVRMVHFEGVAYEVRADKPWKWNDYIANVKTWTVEELLAEAAKVAAANQAVDLADWVNTFGARLESNFHLIYTWANKS